MKKEDLDKPATRAELLAIEKDLRELTEKVVTKAEFNHRLDDLERRMNQMVTKDDWNKHMTMMDEMITEIRESREARILYERHALRTDDIVHDHEKRICVLEKAA